MNDESLLAVDRLSGEQRRILALANDFLSELKNLTPIGATQLAAVRWSFASSLFQHLAAKERYIYSKLDKDERAEIRDYYARSKADLTRLYDEYIAHMEAWPTFLSVNRWTTYRMVATAVVESFVARLSREDTELYPLIRRHRIDISKSSPVTINWVRKAFEVKSKVDND